MEQNKAARRRFACLVLLCALAASPVDRGLNAAARGGDDAEVQNSLDAFTRIYEVVERNYADTIDPDGSIFGPPNSNLGAIPGMLRTLDPHSSFLDRHNFQKLREDQEGRYYGVGIKIGQRPGKMGKPVTVVVSPLPGSPAFRAGLRSGDVIIAVNGKSTEDMNYLQVAELLKGAKGTMVRVTVSREGSEQPLEFTIIRDEISHRSVQAAFLVRPEIGYIRISNFNENTNDELSEALKKLDVRNLRAMILDLRSNPGGLLQEAVDVADHFLEKNQLIVYHSGRHSREKRYYVAKGDKGNEYPMVVLINRLTASAAEILTAALQDHDRALVIGEPSFGKGLVQTVFALSEHTGLALTTAHYYTPSGRLIQRDFTDLSPYDYYSHFEGHAPSHREVRWTDGGREVYSGGGITPDVFASGTCSGRESCCGRWWWRKDDDRRRHEHW